MADYEYVNSTGVIVPDTSVILEGVQNEYKTSFGQDLITTPDTPQGVLITAETLARDEVVRNNAAVANQINPNVAGGTFLDDICALTGLERDPSTRSTVTGTLTGVAGTIIPAGSRAKTTNENLFETISTVVIGVGGSVNANFQSVDYGPVDAPAGTLDQIVDGVLGWENVTNSGDAVLGQLEQSDQSLRALRRITLALQGTALPEAITSGLANTEGVKSFQFRENISASSETIDGILMIAHSIYASVHGGTDDDVAQTLLDNKSLGAGYNGGTTVNVVDPASGQTYAVKFDRPDEIEIDIRATVKLPPASTISPEAAVKEAIMAYVNGDLTGEPGFAVGVPVSCFELAGSINQMFPEIFVVNMETKTGADPFSNAEIPIAIDEVAVTDATNIAVVVV